MILILYIILSNTLELYEAVQSNIGGGDSIAFNSSSDIASYPMAAVASGTPSGQNVVVKTSSGDKVQDELYALNPAFVAAAAAAGYQFISKEQQQMWEVRIIFRYMQINSKFETFLTNIIF